MAPEIKEPSLLNRGMDLLQDQVELFLLEWQYEKKQGWRRLWTGGVGVFLMLTAFVFLQIAFVRGLVRWGGSLGWVCLGLGLFYAVLGIILCWRFGRRDARAGDPFQKSREELEQNFKWIQKLFS